MSENRDYSLLRPFDLEAAKRGEEICYYDESGQLTYVFGPDAHDVFVLISNGDIRLEHSNYLRMSPLCWVEGKPVYRGDTLYGIGDCKDLIYIVDTFDDYCIQSQPGTSGRRETPDNLTWTQPKTKREGWMNCYKDRENYVYPTKELADRAACEDRVACVRIEWEE